MEKNKTIVFEQFARKAAERLEKRKKLRTERLRVKSIDMEIEIRGLSDAEMHDCMDFSEDNIEQDRYTLFMASPTLQEAGKILKENGTLQQEYKIAEMFTAVEQSYMVNRVLELSGYKGNPDIEVIKEEDEVKNS